jgi:hypothetical protein
VVATDADDPTGMCNHTTQSSLYHLMVTNPGGAANLAPCAPCSHDVDCGGDADNCVTVGGGNYCGKTCTGDGDCPMYYGCQLVTSVDGTAAKQCVPKSGSCTNIKPAACVDDAREPNDNLMQASTQAPLEVATLYNMESCPDGIGGTNPDWYRIDLADDADITITLAGGSTSDLDLQLTDAQGNPLGISNGNTSNESIERCLAKGTYYVQVYSSTASPAANAYTLSYSGANTSCTPAVCMPDAYEPDNDPSMAQKVVFGADGTYQIAGRTICLGDVDWYLLHLTAGQTLYVSLTFAQLNASQDLDLDVWAGSTHLTPCDTTIPCSAATGQSSDANEYYVHTADADADYYVAVLGYQGATNTYDICISTTAGLCPVYP